MNLPVVNIHVYYFAVFFPAFSSELCCISLNITGANYHSVE